MGEDYKYMIISSYKPFELRRMEKIKAMRKVGLYDGEEFHQLVKCRECGGEMYVIFNKLKEPEVAQCINCGYIGKVYFTFTINFRVEWENE